MSNIPYIKALNLSYSESHPRKLLKAPVNKEGLTKYRTNNITTPNITTITQGDLLLFMVDQVGALVPGRDLSLTLYCEVV